MIPGDPVIFYWVSVDTRLRIIMISLEGPVNLQRSEKQELVENLRTLLIIESWRKIQNQFILMVELRRFYNDSEFFLRLSWKNITLFRGIKK